jgi:hypothetical protein
VARVLEDHVHVVRILEHRVQLDDVGVARLAQPQQRSHLCAAEKKNKKKHRIQTQESHASSQRLRLQTPPQNLPDRAHPCEPSQKTTKKIHKNPKQKKKKQQKQKQKKKRRCPTVVKKKKQKKKKKKKKKKKHEVRCPARDENKPNHPEARDATKADASANICVVVDVTPEHGLHCTLSELPLALWRRDRRLGDDLDRDARREHGVVREVHEAKGALPEDPLNAQPRRGVVGRAEGVGHGARHVGRSRGRLGLGGGKDWPSRLLFFASGFFFFFFFFSSLFQ